VGNATASQPDGDTLVLEQAILHVQAAAGGPIDTTASVASVVAAGRSSDCDASEDGVLQLTRAAAAEYVTDTTRANCILPGRVETSLTATGVRMHGRTGTQAARSPAPCPTVTAKRRADLYEIAVAVALLASEVASFATGAAIASEVRDTAI